MEKRLLARHGKSLWNIENIFTRWTDIDPAHQGIEEAKNVGLLIKKIVSVLIFAFPLNDLNHFRKRRYDEY